MELVITLCLLAATALTYVNLRDAELYCSLLVGHEFFLEAEIDRRRRLLLLFGLAVAMCIVLAALATVPAAERAEVPEAGWLLMLLFSSALIYSQLFEQWSGRQCRRLVVEPAQGEGRDYIRPF